MPAAPTEILTVWRKFNAYPMETLTKAWFLRKMPGMAQRTVPQMQDHRAKYGGSGNCFDLGLWLMHELKAAGIPCYGVGHDWGTTDAHVAVVALDGAGRRYLCDLGDLWIQPLLLDGDSRELCLRKRGFFTGAEISAEVEGNRLRVKYHRPGGKESGQEYDLTPVSEKDFFEFGNFSQRNLSAPLVEQRIFLPDEIVHWEYAGHKSFVSSMSGLAIEPPLLSRMEWSDRISRRTGMKAKYVAECLEAYEELAKNLSKA